SSLACLSMVLMPPALSEPIEVYKSQHPGMPTKTACAGPAFQALLDSLDAAQSALPAAYIRKDRKKMKKSVYQVLARLNKSAESAEEKEESRKKSRERYANKSAEEKEESSKKNRERYANKSAEEKEESRKKRSSEESRKKRREAFANKSAEEKEESRKKGRENYAELTEEQREKRNTRKRDIYETLTTEQRQERRGTPAQIEQASTNAKEKKALKDEADKCILPCLYPLYTVWEANPDEFKAVFDQAKLEPVKDALLEPVRERFAGVDTASVGKGTNPEDVRSFCIFFPAEKTGDGSFLQLYMNRAKAQPEKSRCSIFTWREGFSWDDGQKAEKKRVLSLHAAQDFVVALGKDRLCIE
ncbi:hypothetical protein TeGR_g6829, partial [Tetraparma gracilis]